MTAPRALSDDERKKLLNDLATLKSDDDDAVQQDPKWFLPLDAHVRALRPETLVVRGGRGAGKTALFHFLGHMQREPELAEKIGAAADPKTTWVEGFSAASDHPSTMLMGRFGRQAKDDERRGFWFAWLCARIANVTGKPLPGELENASQHPESLARAAHDNLDKLSRFLDDIEKTQQHRVVVTYDNLDRTGDSSASRPLTASLLALWLSLSDRYRMIRPKVFVREDLFRASLSAFPDASKLDARSTSIEWRVEDLFRVLIKHMANTSDELQAWVASSRRGIPLACAGKLGFVPPESLPQPLQKNFVDHLAGEQMGKGEKKGYTYRWIPNRLQDAHTRVVPRSILSLIRNAAELALSRGPKARSLRILAPEELQGALEKTSKRRVDELKEEFPVVVRLENLRNEFVMLDRQRAVHLLARPIEGSTDDFGSEGESVLQALMDLGVVSVRPDNRIDVPDIYRYGFGIRRKGGVKRPR